MTVSLLLPGNVRREWCNAVNEVLRHKAELVDGILDVAEYRDPVSHSIEVFTRIHAGLGAVGHSRNLVFFRMPHQSIGDLAVQLPQLTFAVDKCLALIGGTCRRRPLSYLEYLRRQRPVSSGASRLILVYIIDPPDAQKDWSDAPADLRLTRNSKIYATNERASLRSFIRIYLNLLQI